MKPKNLSILFVSLVLLISGCGTSSDVHVVNFTPTGKVNQLTTFTIELSENVAPIDKQNQWLSDEFVEFEPKIPGKFKWISGNMLVFSSDQPLQPIQSYKARITNRVMFDSKLSYDFDDYEFQTPDFDINKAEFFWSHVPNEKFKVSVKANLHFNYPVNPGMLKDYLLIEHDGNAVSNYQIISDNTADIIAISIGDVSQTDRDQEYKVIIKSGLLSTVGKKPLEDAREFKYDLPSVTKLVITDVSSGFDGQMGWIEVHTTQMADEKQIGNYVSVTPSKNLKFYVSENSFRIEGEFSEASLVNLKITKGLPGLYGGDLENEFEQDVSFVDLNPSISFSDRKGKYLMLCGERNLQLNAVNIPGAEIEV
jgi:hypothetical protein